MDRDDIARAIQRKRLEDSLRQDFESSLPERINRSLDVKSPPIMPNWHFAPVSVECAALFRDGHFYGCIAMTQAVAEALVRFLCEQRSIVIRVAFQTNVRNLFKNQVISGNLKQSLLKIWAKRNDYHHLNKEIEQDLKTLETMARLKVKLLKEVEGEIFKFTSHNGKLAAENPQYWKPTDNAGLTKVFLNIEP